MRVEVNTRLYQFSHGKMPRGRGSWAFQIGAEEYWSAPGQTYADAVRDARKLAVARNEREVKVLP